MQRGPKIDPTLAHLSELDRRRVLELLEEKTAAAAPKPVTSSFIQSKIAEASLHKAPSPVVVDKHPLAKVLQLPLWANEERGAPNAWLRSSLFRVVEKGARGYHQGTELPAWGNVTLKYWGSTLDQGDLDVALQCIHMARQGAPGREVVFTDAGMMRALGRGAGSRMMQWFEASMMRLRTCVFRFENVDGGFETENLLTVYRSPRKADKERCFVVNPVVIPLFIDDDYTLVQWKSRLALKGQLAKWLHAFLSTHRSTASGVRLTTLHHLAGISETRLPRLFRYDLEKALTQLRALDDEHLGLMRAEIVDGSEEPKLVWARRPNRRFSLHQGRRG